MQRSFNVLVFNNDFILTNKPYPHSFELLISMHFTVVDELHNTGTENIDTTAM